MVSADFHIAAVLAVIGLPLLSFLVSALMGRRMKSGLPGTIALALSLVGSLYLFPEVWNSTIVRAEVSWFTIGDRYFGAGIWVNNLSVLMLSVVSAVALLVHIYSAAYMKGDPGIHRYWMYLSLFCFAMLALVVVDNLLLMYVCWELVGFASYLLIGFWFTKDAAVQANKKAFIVNRIGDIGFLIGMAVMYTQFGTLNLPALFGADGLVQQAVVSGGNWIAGAHAMPAGWLTAAGLAFFLGAMAKSAQFPLHAWLPDAMEGPTSVSALIHAATMVAAGVFMLVRIFPVFDVAALDVMVATGSFTALMAAFIALTQNDLKKILAFSTISQLGFMVAAVGIGVYGVALFHLVTHAFFKCLLFLAAGAVIHEVKHAAVTAGVDVDPQDIRLMGGLRRQMPVTFMVCFVGALALAGLPLTAGYLSKDALLIHAFEWSALHKGMAGLVPFTLLLTSALTAFYIARMLFKVFYGKNRMDEGGGRTFVFHDAVPAMRMPMLILAFCSLFPLFSVNPLLFEDTWLLNGFPHPQGLQRVNVYHTVVPAVVNAFGIVMIFLAWRWYARQKYPLKGAGWWYRLSKQQVYMDSIYMYGIAEPALRVAGVVAWVDRYVVDGVVHLLAAGGRALAAMAAWVDRYVVDVLVNGAGRLASWLGDVGRRSQTGRLQYYMLSMFLVVLAVWLYNYFNTL